MPYLRQRSLTGIPASASFKIATIWLSVMRLLIVKLLCFSLKEILRVGCIILRGSYTAGIAVGFAAQNLVSNFFGGLTIFASRIFKLGDDIILKSSDLSGTVIHIGWRSTTIEGWDGKRVYVPNSIFNTENLINHSRLTHRTLSEDILLSYEDFDKVPEVVEEGNKLLEAREDLKYFVFRFSEFGDKALKLSIYAWVKTPEGDNRFVPYASFAKAQEEILLGIADIAHAKGCKVLPINHVRINEAPVLETEL